MNLYVIEYLTGRRIYKCTSTYIGNNISTPCGKILDEYGKDVYSVAYWSGGIQTRDLSTVEV